MRVKLIISFFPDLSYIIIFFDFFLGVFSHNNPKHFFVSIINTILNVMTPNSDLWLDLMSNLQKWLIVSTPW